MNDRRLFFAFKTIAPWPSSYPQGRLVLEEFRHLTVAFLGNCQCDRLLQALKDSPPIAISVSPVGMFDKCLFLHKRHPNVVAWHINWLSNPTELIAFQKRMLLWLAETGYAIQDSTREWLPHVTIARQPFDQPSWELTFITRPMALGDFCLYESVGGLNYQPIWSLQITPPFNEIEHTADLAFEISGTTLAEICAHAQIALAFKFPEVMPYMIPRADFESLDEIVMHLNKDICRADSAIGCPFKAVSFHGELKRTGSNVMKWEMIIDV